MERVGRKRSSSARNEEMERVGDTGKNGTILCNRPKPTAGCSANGRSYINAPMEEEVTSMHQLSANITRDISSA